MFIWVLCFLLEFHTNETFLTTTGIAELKRETKRNNLIFITYKTGWILSVTQY